MNLSIYPPALASVLHTTEQLWLPSMWQSECNTSEHYQPQRQATALYSFCFDTRPGPGQWPAAGGWSVGVGLAYDAQSLQAIQTTRLVLPAYGFLSQPPAGRPVTACRGKPPGPSDGRCSSSGWPGARGFYSARQAPR